MKISFCTWITDRLWQYCQTLERNIEAAAGHDVEFVLFDNHSTDGLHEWLDSRGLLDAIRYIRPTEQIPLHMGHLKNMAHQHATGEILVSLDADNIIGPRYCERLFEVLTDDFTFSHFWSGDWADGTCGRLAYTRTAFDRLGGYDEALGPVGNDDLDLRDRAIAMGYHIALDNSPEVVGSAILNTTPQKAKLFGIDWDQSNSANGAKSRENIEDGILIANTDKV